MSFIVELTDITTLIALYAGVISTVGIFWQIYVYFQSKVKLAVNLLPNQRLDDKQEGKEINEEKFIYMLVKNVGVRPTTIRNVFILGFKNRLSYVHKKYVPVDMANNRAKPLPHKVEVGEMWDARINQKTIEEAITTHDLKMVFVGVSYISKNKLKLQRLNIKQLSKTNA